MASQPQPASPGDETLGELAACFLAGRTEAFRSLARQPIQDRRGVVQGYELNFWSGKRPACVPAEGDGLAETPAACKGKGLAASALLGKALIFGVERLTSGLPAFMKYPDDAFTEEWMRGLPPELTVVEVPGDREPSPSLLAVCKALKEAGFRLALDDFTGNAELMPLLEAADFVKVDMARANAAERRSLRQGLRRFEARSVAKNVETQEDYWQVCEEGFELFQGYYFCRPAPLKSHTISGNRLVHLEILEVLHKEPVDLDRLSQLVMCDAALTYGLLRLVNSPLCAMRQAVTSIHSALMLLGEATARRIAMLTIASDFNTDQPPELLRMAFERARFCELSAGLLGLAPAEQYLIGMVSMFPAMLRVPVEDLVRMLPLRAGARDALLGKRNPEGALLHLMESQDRGDWAACEQILQANGLRFDQLMWRLGDAIEWANTALKTAR